jgi:hypothetical protein
MISFKEIRKKLGLKLLEAGGGGGSSSQITNTNLKNFIIKHLGYKPDSDDYTAAESDLAEVRSAIETDSYIKVALDKTFQLVFKAGYKITSKNDSAVEYLKQRLSLMSFGTGMPWDVMLEELARDLVFYSNAFWVKSRVDKIMGGLQAKPVLGKKPVGGYFRTDPTTMEIKRDNSGTIKSYKQQEGSEEKEYKAEDVVHFFVDREANNNFGTPRVLAALEDVKILRKVEGNTLSLIYRFTIPLYQMIIGLPQENMMATQKEIEDAQDQLNKMPLDGIIITNERTAFKAIGAEGKAIEVGDYLRYYEKRVFTALNMSEAMMGRGGSRQNADSMEGIMHDTVKYYQKMISIFIENCVFTELLLEGGFNPIFTPDDWVSFEFNEINLDTKVKMENHELVKFQDNAITFEEMRRAIGRGADQVDESRLYSNMITQPNELELINAKVAASGTTGNGNIKNGKTAKTQSNGEAKSMNSPKNQHGTTSARVKESLYNGINLREFDMERVLKTENHVNSYHEQFPKMYKKYAALRNERIEKGNFSKRSIAKHSAELRDILNEYLEDAVRQGYAKSQLSDHKVELGDIHIDFSEVTKRADADLDRFVANLFKKVEAADNIDSCFNFMEFRLRFICVFWTQKAYWYGDVKGYAVQSIPKLDLDLTDTHKDRKSTISTDSFDIDDIPPFAPYCSCGIKDPEKRSV